MLHRLFSLTLALALSLCLTQIPTQANSLPTGEPLHAGSFLLMEQSTGTILLQHNASTPLPPASITKIMTILLLMDSIQSQEISKDELVTISPNAASLGGSQVYLKEGETMSVWELLKCVVVVSANDASVALAEHLMGSESAFVQAMNQKAQSLGMSQTLFQNCTGLPAQDHYSTAHDIALMSQALLSSHPSITEFTTIWMDSIRNGEFLLSNTNQLIHSYPGASGLKTGSTDEALFCLSASASRNNLDLIAVVLQAPSSQLRFQDAAALLDYGFQHFSLEEIFPSAPLPPIPLILGSQDYYQAPPLSPVPLLLHQSEKNLISTSLQFPDSLPAPLSVGDQIASFHIYVDNSLRISQPIYATESIPRLTLLEIYEKLFRNLVMAS